MLVRLYMQGLSDVYRKHLVMLIAVFIYDWTG